MNKITLPATALVAVALALAGSIPAHADDEPVPLVPVPDCAALVWIEGTETWDDSTGEPILTTETHAGAALSEQEQFDECHVGPLVAIDEAQQAAYDAAQYTAEHPIVDESGYSPSDNDVELAPVSPDPVVPAGKVGLAISPKVGL